MRFHCATRLIYAYHYYWINIFNHKFYNFIKDKGINKTYKDKKTFIDIHAIIYIYYLKNSLFDKNNDINNDLIYNNNDNNDDDDVK